MPTCFNNLTVFSKFKQCVISTNLWPAVQWLCAFGYNHNAAPKLYAKDSSIAEVWSYLLWYSWHTHAILYNAPHMRSSSYYCNHVNVCSVILIFSNLCGHLRYHILVTRKCFESMQRQFLLANWRNSTPPKVMTVCNTLNAWNISFLRAKLQMRRSNA